MRRSFPRAVAVAAAMALPISLAGLTAPASADSHTDPSPGDETITLTLNDSAAGGDFELTFEKAFGGVTSDGTPVYIYVPQGGVGDPSVEGLDPAFDHNPGDEFAPCADAAASDYLLTQEQIDLLGAELVGEGAEPGIVEVDEAHFGDLGLADPSDPDSGALVTLVYNVQDEQYYDCSVTSYTAGYFAPDFLESYGMNTIVIDAYDWANRVGDQEGNPDGQSQLYEGVIAHELEHLLHHYSDPGELSWVDEGLADFAMFLNAYDVGGSHLTYHQVFHRETSLTRWGGGLENYGASYTYFQYLWEQAGGNGDGTFTPDQEYDGQAGDLLIQLVFEEDANDMAGVQAAIDRYNAQTGANLRSAEELFRDWAVAIYLDDETSDRFDIKAADFGNPDDTSWTIDMANDAFFDGRGQYKGNMPDARWENSKKVPGQTALPFGTSYETFRNPGPTFDVVLDGEDVTRIAPHTGETHWWGGAESQADKLLEVATDGDVQTLDFWSWHFIEEGWDYGFVEALVDGEWVTVPVFDDAGQEVTTDEDPHGNNTEGNGITGTSGGEYFVDEPEYVHLTADLPEGTSDVRFRYSTDAAYLDTGWFVDDVVVDGAPATLDGGDDWVLTNGAQDNNWTLQLLAPCDLTPGVTSEGEIVDAGNHVYRFTGGSITESGFDTACLRGSKDSVTAVISNSPTGDLNTLDADYLFRLTGTGYGNGKGKS
jgi:hypothetical protein